MSFSTATLVYSVTPQGPVSLDQMSTAMAAVDLSQDEADFASITGATLTSDTTAISGTVVERTIVFGITGTQFLEEFPAGSDQTMPFWGLFTQTLSSALDAFVSAANPVLA